MEMTRGTPVRHPGRVPLDTVIMRGGSSKALFLREDDLPKDREARTRMILALFGSPDRRQIDGLGGSDYLTSKCAIMGPPSRSDADIDYTFLQVGVDHPIVSYDINCGNISAAAGLYAVEEGFVAPDEPHARVRVHNTNTGKILLMYVPTHGGAAITEGDFAIDGVPGTGAEIRMDFSGTSGAVTGRLLPTGNEIDRLHVASLARTIEVSIVDIANTCVFIRGAEIGLTGAEQPQELTTELQDLLEEIRVEAARMAGLESYLLPFQVIVGEPQSYPDYLTPRTIPDTDHDLVARLVVDRMMHKAYAGTGATCLATAARISGTVVDSVTRKRNDRVLRIGHPSGTLPITAEVSRVAEGWNVEEVLFSRTARRLMDGRAWLRESRL